VQCPKENGEFKIKGKIMKTTLLEMNVHLLSGEQLVLVKEGG